VVGQRVARTVAGIDPEDLAVDRRDRQHDVRVERVDHDHPLHRLPVRLRLVVALLGPRSGKTSRWWRPKLSNTVQLLWATVANVVVCPSRSGSSPRTCRARASSRSRHRAASRRPVTTRRCPMTSAPRTAPRRGVTRCRVRPAGSRLTQRKPAASAAGSSVSRSPTSLASVNPSDPRDADDVAFEVVGPRVVGHSATRTSGFASVARSARISNASACSPSPARIAVASSKARWVVGRPRLKSSSVHRRQIVVDQRIGMDAFDRRARAYRTVVGSPKRPRRLHSEEGPEPLAAAKCRIPHRRDEALGPRRLAGLRLDAKQSFELAFNRGLRFRRVSPQRRYRPLARYVLTRRSRLG